MADSNALRQRRKYAHRAGNHSLCDPRRCEAARRADYDPVAEDGELEPSSMTAVTLKALSSLPFGEGDPRFITATICLKLAQVFDLYPSVQVAAEIRRQVDSLLDRPEAAPDVLDRIRAQVSVKQMGLLIQAASGREQRGLVGGSEEQTLAKLAAWRPADWQAEVPGG